MSTRFHPVFEHSGGEYSQRFAHNERGHRLQTILLNTVNKVPGRLIREASLREDEQTGIDFKVDDLKHGVVKVQFKSFELGQEEISTIIRSGIVPIGIEGDLVSMCRPRSGSYSEDAVESVQKSFWAQYDAFAGLAHDAQYGGKVSDNQIKDAMQKAVRDSVVHYEGV